MLAETADARETTFSFSPGKLEPGSVMHTETADTFFHVLHFLSQMHAWAGPGKARWGDSRGSLTLALRKVWLGSS